MKRILEKWKKLNVALKIYIICILVMSISGVMGILINASNIEYEFIETAKNDTEKIKSTYVLNKAGFLKSSNILDEQYNDKGDLIYYKYKNNNNEIIENYYSYTYDDLGRVTEIALKNGNNIKITYSNENYIDNIVTTTSIAGGASYVSNYNFTYDLSNLMTTIEKVMSIYVNNQLYSKELSRYIVTEKIVNGKNYIGVKEFDSNGQQKLIKIYNKKENVNGCSLKKLSMLPLDYVDSINMYSYINYIVSGIEFDNFIPAFNIEHMIYSYDYENRHKTTIDYDEEGKILLIDVKSPDSDNDFNYMSKYEKVNDTTYIKYMLNDLGTNYLASGADSRYELDKCKLYYNDNNEICKIEQYEEENLSEYEYISQKNEYEAYVNKNKIDVTKIISLFDSLNSDEYSNIYNTVKSNSISSLTNEVKNELTDKEKAKSILDNVNVQIDIGEGADIEETGFSPAKYGISATYFKKYDIDFKIEKIVVTNKQNGSSKELIHESDDSFIGVAEIDLVEGENTIELTVYDNYGNTIKITKTTNKWS